FVQMLDAVRVGTLSPPRTITMFQHLKHPVVYKDGVEPTELFPTCKAVNNSNYDRLLKLAGTKQIYEALDGGTEPDVDRRTRLLGDLFASEKLVLRLQAHAGLLHSVFRKR
ncbi:hypothetical protein R3P38DRAFT_2544993, partial [Favolaschia claudopus]